jgi:hypothetical protein
MDGERQLGRQAGARHELAHIARRHRTAAVRDKQLRAVGPVTTQLAQGAQLRSPEGVRRGHALFQPLDGEQSRLEVKLFSAQADRFTDAMIYWQASGDEGTANIIGHIRRVLLRRFASKPELDARRSRGADFRRRIPQVR